MSDSLRGYGTSDGGVPLPEAFKDIPIVLASDVGENTCPECGVSSWAVALAFDEFLGCSWAAEPGCEYARRALADTTTGNPSSPDSGSVPSSKESK